MSSPAPRLVRPLRKARREAGAVPVESGEMAEEAMEAEAAEL